MKVRESEEVEKVQKAMKLVKAMKSMKAMKSLKAMMSVKAMKGDVGESYEVDFVFCDVNNTMKTHTLFEVPKRKSGARKIRGHAQRRPV